MSRHPRTAVATTASVALLLGAVLTGCTGDEGQDPESAPSQTEPGEPLASVDAEGYPLDYPKDEIPLIKGDITSTEIGDEENAGYAFTILTDKAPAAALSDAVDLLADADWTSRSEVNPGSLEPQVLNRDKDLVIVTSVDYDGGALVSYSVQLG